MKFFGLEFKFNNFDIWHKGNFTPPTKLSQFTNDVGYITSAGSGAKILVSTTAPASPSSGDFWYKQI